jgi:hypothetical protein
MEAALFFEEFGEVFHGEVAGLNHEWNEFNE